MLRVGIVGSGFGLYGLLPAFNSLGNCSVVSICGKKTTRLVEYCKNIQLESIYTEWDRMINSEQLEILALAVPPQLQYEIAKVAIKKGLHIFAEKPLAVTYLQAKELLFLASEHKVIHAIDFIFPEIDEWQIVKNMLDEKKLGDLRKISVKWDFLSYDIRNKISSWKTNIAEGGGALSFYFSHVLYYLEYFIGEILETKSTLLYSPESINGGEVGVDLLLRFKNNVKGTAHLLCNNRELNGHQLVFECQNGIIMLESNNNTVDNFVVKVLQNGNIKIVSQSQKTKLNKDEDERIKLVKKIAYRFVNACISREQVIPSFIHGVRVQELLKMIRDTSISYTEFKKSSYD